ncbi:GNAT family N-acetyltransferase [Chryseobacterium taklimakanense]|uniref:GNAT family N-acetyltransferase n=1 Tax=Chryseobacterium taklimakanense TaxID=536441 RepID=UPI001EF50855|nr:GNAT family N-acetyltransferase [Chryseobacterium taklimakanense]MCG7280336.1 GNAT family N-acetyltransferase [Chryseobacterium taklimakanense]
MEKYIETPRLLLREIVPEDVGRMFLLDSNADVMKYIGVAPLTTHEQSEEVIKKVRSQYRENGIGRWAVIERKSGLLIGWSGLKFLTEEINGYKNVYEIGYRFLPEFWGKGYATEAGKAWLDYGFNNMKIPFVYAVSHSENQSSIHTLEKLGFIKTEEFFDHDGLCYWYVLNKEDFNNLTP